MGNSPSNSDSEEDKEHIEMDGSSSDNEDGGEKNSATLTDLKGLFSHTSLRAMAAKIKEEIPENVLQQYRFQILRWLEERENKMEESLTISQFCDWLVNKGVSRDDAVKAFQQFDTDGSGVVEVNTIIEMVKSMNGPSILGELGRSIRMLQACSLTPGFVDVYAGDQNAVKRHAEKVLKYLLRNRSPSMSLPFPYLNGFNNTANMRNSVLKTTFKQLKEAASTQEQGSLGMGEEVRTVSPCYSNIEVSSNTSDAYRLTNGDPSTFWQSDGSARSHWIRLHIKANVVLKTLSINVASSDSSYMPEVVSVSAGKNFRSLRAIKEVRISSHVTGDVVLLKSAKTFYPVIQINIKRCRNDGCDTRIHGIKTVGYKVIREPGVSVADASAMWYLQVLASTVTMTMPLAPSLRPTILEQTRKALGHIPPLSLCPASSERPQFLSKFVLQEVEKFVSDIAIYNGEVVAEGLHMLLSFNLARGNVAALLRTVKLFQEHPETNLACASLLLKTEQARNACWEKSGHQLNVSLCGTDGGQSDDSTAPENVLNNQSWSTPVQTSYVSEEGKTKVNMVFKSTEMVQITKLRIRVVPGVKGVKRGLIFVYRDDSKEFDIGKHVERFKTYDTWGKIEYDFSVQVRSAGIAGKPDNPVAYFTFDDDCDEIDIPVSWHPVGQFVFIKFLEPRQESANKIGIVGIKMYGFIRKSVMVDNEIKVHHPPNPKKKTTCTSLEIIHCVLQFLIDLSQDQAQRKTISSGKPEYLEFTDLPLETVWELYNAFNDGEEKWPGCSELTLQLLYCLLPALSSLTGERKNAAEAVFQHLCKVTDDENKNVLSKKYRICKQLIIDGAAVFFPDKEARRKQLFSMMQNVESLSKASSVMLVFQSLCQFFSSVDPSGLLDLPKTPSDNFSTDSLMDIMETMISVTCHEFANTIETGQIHEQVVHLLQLVSSLQASLMSWCWGQMVPEEGENGPTQTGSSDFAKEVATQVISRYALFVSKKGSMACNLLLKQSSENLEKCMEILEMSLLGSVIRQLVLILSYLCDFLDSPSRVSLVQGFQALNQDLHTLASKLPSTFPDICSEHWASVQTEDIVLRTWEVESSHNYENNQHQTQVFSCPGANKFVLDFDPRCETERRYDYLVFTDARGLQMRFDQKVGSAKWPRQVNFSGPNLHFLFHSDSSNTEWGYKFRVTARGSPDVPLSWSFDLQLSLTKMLGRLCGATLNAHPYAGKDTMMGMEETAEQEVLRSQLWTTLFRGGYMIGKIQRSLSGKFATTDSGLVLEFLWEVINKKEGPPCKLIEKCKEHCKGMRVGGDEIDSAVTAVFAALMWHTQQLREELQKIVLSLGDHPIPDGILLAYTTADSLRMQLLNQRQKMAAEKGNEDADDPATICRDKALFLLKFAGLTKVQLKNEIRSKSSKQWKKLSNRRSDKQSKYDASEKYPSFRLVLDFVQDPAWTTDRMNHMLQQRSKHAKAVADVYCFCTEFLRIHQAPNLFQIPVVLFLQEILWYQDGFCKHYADSLDGCGLGQEALVRQSYYSLVRMLTDTFHKIQRHELDKKIAPAYEYIQSSLLHLLDIEWQPYDLSFVNEVNLPALYLNIAKETVKMRECTYGQDEEENELKEYEKCMKWFDECSNGFEKWYDGSKKEDNKDEKKGVQMFVARFCDLLDVEISCDGCGVTLPGRRFRCLQCIDMDLCATCYLGGVKPEGEHSDEHDIVHLVYKCNKCQAFIVGTRIHCNECDDFDLCLGCHEKKAFPSEHDESHDVTRFPLVRLKTSQDSDSMIQAYIHQHVWLLFTILAMSTGETLQADSPGIDSDYIKLATQLQNQCTSIVTQCLRQVPDDAEDSSKVVPLQETDVRAIKSRQEEAFAIHTQERIMGLLGVMIPTESKTLSTGFKYNFTTENFIQLLFKIARGESGHEVNTRHLAMGLLGPLLTKCELSVADEAVRESEPISGDKQMSGQSTVRYLFSFGADCLHKCGLEWACSVARILQSLYASGDWKDVIHHHLTSCVQTLTHKPDLPSIFALFVMAGFPEVLTIGTLVQFSHMGPEPKVGVVLKHFPDKYQTLIINIKTRKRYTIQDKYVDCLSTVAEVWDINHVTVFVNTIKTIVSNIKADVDVAVDTLWVLSLSLKVLNNSLKSTENCIIQELFDPGFIQGLVYIASKGTEFSQQWLLKDFEVLSLMLYTNDGTAAAYKKGKTLSYSEQLAAALEKQTKAKEHKDILTLTGDEDVFDNFDSSSSSCSSLTSDSTVVSGSSMLHGASDVHSLFEDLDEKTRVMFETLHSDLKLPLDVLRAIYDMNDKNPDDVVKAIIENLEGSPITTKDDIKRLSQKWESIAHAKSPEAAIATAVSDKVIDTGIHYHPVMKQRSRVLEKATEEEWVESQKLIQTPDNDMEDDIQKQHRSKSAELLKRELEKHGRSRTTEYTRKVNMAMAVLYARQVLTSLLAHWPDNGPTINAELLGCKDVQQIPCVLDLLNKSESRDRFQMVVEKLIKHCETDNLVPIASTAGQFMEEVTLSSITKESPHNYKDNAAVKDKIQLPGASCLRVSFDSKCALKDGDDTLVFSTSSDLEQDRHEFTGTVTSNWTSFQVAGDTVHYEFSVNGSEKTFWGYKFTVTAGTRDSFETGYAILNNVLLTNLALSLPVSELWQILVYVATKQAAQQRLKTIQLLLKIIQSQRRLSKDQKLQLDLSLLKPLWQMYNNLTKQEVDSNIVLSPVIRALTELFLQVESLAMEWDIVTEYLLAIQDFDEIRKIFEQGIKNIAAVSVMIGYSNLATELVTLVKKKKSSDK